MPSKLNPFRTDVWQIRYLFELGFQGWLVHVGVVSLTGSLLIRANPGAVWPFVWTGVMLVLSGAMAWLSKTHAPGSHRGDRAYRRAGRWHTGLTALVGVSWGTGAILVSHNHEFGLLAVYTLTLSGTALGAVSSQHAVPRSAFTSIWTSVPLLAAAHALEGRNWPMGAMVLLFALILSILTLRMYRFLAINYNLARSLDAKVAELTRASTDLIAAREEAEAANLSKSRFLAQASHDLRQPIHAIGLLTASLSETRLNREQRQMVESVGASVESVTSLFASLLDLSRLDVGGVVPRPAPLDLGGFLDRIVVQNRDLARRSHCTVSKVASTAWVHTDDSLLFTMVQNVLGNAFKYAPGSRVLIGPRRIGGRLALQICDTGPGIEAAQTDAVFSEFYRLQKPQPGGAVEGMGLGLPIVRRLGHLLGLEVRLTSEPGRGTSVIVTGLAPVAPSPAAAPPRKARSHPLAGMRICLIDDDASVRTATTGLLARWGCVVETASDPGGLGHDCDAIMADLQLGGGMSGIDAVMALRNKAGRAIPAVILTGHSGPETQARIAAANLPVLSKPVHPPELRAMLTRLCLGL